MQRALGVAVEKPRLAVKLPWGFTVAKARNRR